MSTDSENGAESAVVKGFDRSDVFGTLANVISIIFGVDRDSLTPDQKVADLGLDSLFAGEILARTERTLDIDIEFRQISDDWSDLTLGDLADQLWAMSSVAARQPEAES